MPWHWRPARAVAHILLVWAGLAAHLYSMDKLIFTALFAILAVALLWRVARPTARDEREAFDEPFSCVPALEAKDFVLDLRLCRVLLEDDADYLWIFLVPRRSGVANLLQLAREDRLQLMREMAMAGKVLQQLFPCDQLNVAMIGNRTPQLHVHLICRRKGDPDWPGTVWGRKGTPYAADEKQKIVRQLVDAFREQFADPDNRQSPKYDR
jgi:diadenosine tetraphosphate (Ap4A) HIT family hydrolase